jgi:hypothetical protein
MVGKKISEFDTVNDLDYLTHFVPFEDFTNELNFKVDRLDINPGIKINKTGILTAAQALGTNSLALGLNSISNATNSLQLGSGTNNTSNSLQFLTNNFVNQFTIQAKVTFGIPIDSSVTGAVQVNSSTNSLVLKTDTNWINLVSEGYISVEPSIDTTLRPTGSTSNCIAIGPGAASNGPNSTAIGFNCQSSGTRSLAIGYLNSSSGNYSIALGQPDTLTFSPTQASGENAIAIGNFNNASGTNAISFGNTLVNSGQDNIVIGMLTNAIGTRNIILNSSGVGNSSNNSSADSICIGPNSRTEQINCVCIGDSAGSSSAGIDTLGAVNIGDTSVSFTGGVGLGYGARGTSGGVGLSFQSNASGTNSVSIGYNALTSGANAINFSSGGGSSSNTIVSNGSIVWGVTSQALIKTQTNSAVPTLTNPTDGTLSMFTGASGFLYVRTNGVWKKTISFVP